MSRLNHAFAALDVQGLQTSILRRFGPAFSIVKDIRVRLLWRTGVAVGVIHPSILLYINILINQFHDYETSPSPRISTINPLPYNVGHTSVFCLTGAVRCLTLAT